MYPHPKPQAPAQLWLLAALTVFGLIALWLAAFYAFQNVAGPGQAFFAASLIEAGIIIEALAAVRFGNVFAKVGLIASFAVSATYNYLQASQAAETLATWPLLALALGPLVALASVALALGDTLTRHQVSVELWERDRARWLEQRDAEERARLQQIEDERRDRERQQAEWEREEKARQAEWERKQQELTQKRQERREAERRKAERPRTSAERPPNAAKSGERSPDLDELLDQVREQSNGRPLSPADVQALAGLGRTKAFDLLKYGRESGQLAQVGRGAYEFVNGREEK